MKIPTNAITQVVEALLRTDAYVARKFLSERDVVRATRVSYRRPPFVRKGGQIDIRLTIGRPNDAERQFICVAKRAGEPFPVRKVQLLGFSSHLRGERD